MEKITPIPSEVAIARDCEKIQSKLNVISRLQFDILDNELVQRLKNNWPYIPLSDKCRELSRQYSEVRRDCLPPIQSILLLVDIEIKDPMILGKEDIWIEIKNIALTMQHAAKQSNLSVGALQYGVTKIMEALNRAKE